MSNLLTAAVAAKALKKDKTEMESAPKNIQESIFAKPLTWAIIAGAGIYLASRFIKKSPTAAEKKDVKVLEQQGQKATYLDSNYKQFADGLYAARAANAPFFWGGTNEQAMYNIFNKMKNDLDVVKLTEAFGSRRLSYSLQNANLGGFLKDELDEEELNIINTGLRSKKINYQF
jgi:hypothetical protein